MSGKIKSRSSRVISLKRLTKEERRIGLLLYPERVTGKPRTRGECKDGQRPCPYVSCRHHLGYEVLPSGSILEVFAGTEVWDLPNSCTLDLAEVPHTLDEVGAVLSLTRERVRQIEEKALAKLREADQLDLDDLPTPPEGLTFPVAPE